MASFHAPTLIWALDFAHTLVSRVYESGLPLVISTQAVDALPVITFRLTTGTLPLGAYNLVRVVFQSGGAELKIVTCANEDVVRTYGPATLDKDSGVIAANHLWADLLHGLTAYMSIRVPS